MTIVHTVDSTNADPWLTNATRFLFAEARALDERRFTDWLDMLADDIDYVMPIVTNRLAREMHLEVGGEGSVAHFDEDKSSLRMRVARLATGMAWAEDPPSRTVRVVSNIEIEERADERERTCHSALVVYRSRLEREVDLYAARRTDVLVDDGADGLKLRSRRILLANATILSKNLSIFF